MDKTAAREWVIRLEEILDKKLVKWRKDNTIPQDVIIQLVWRFEQTFLHLNIFWKDHREMVRLQFTSPQVTHDFTWFGLTDKTFDHIMDRVGNLAQVTMYAISE